MNSDNALRAVYGPNVIISRKGKFALVHLDRPSRSLVRARTREFNPDAYFTDDCPLCQIARESGVVVFDDSDFEDGEILLE